MAFWSWVKTTGGGNATSDSSINWAEGQAPSSVNDSARNMMAMLAQYRDDTAGAISATGSASAYVLSSNQVFANSAAKKFQEIAFVCPATNAAGVTLNVDGLGALPISTLSGTAVPAGTMLALGVYTVLANDTEWILKGFMGNPYNIPIGGGMVYFGTTVPNSNFAFPNGQAISRTTYATLFALLGSGATYGAGDGTTTFNLPDLTGRVPAMKEASATRLTSTYFGGNSVNLGASGGGESIQIATGNLPAYTPAGTITGGIATIGQDLYNGTSFGPAGGGFFILTGPSGTHTFGAHTSDSPVTATFTGTAQGGTQAPFRSVQPTIITNYIMRII